MCMSSGERPSLYIHRVTDSLLGRAACSVKLGQEAGDEASTVVDVVLSVGSRQEAEVWSGEGIFSISFYISQICVLCSNSLYEARRPLYACLHARSAP
jgi:hypothetical protein